MTPQNQVIELAARQDYDTFYRQELPLRELRGCPPFRDLITVTFHGRVEEQTWQTAQRFAAELRAQLCSAFYREEQVELLGPAPAQVARVNYHYRCRLTLSCRNTRTLRQLVAHLVREFAKKTREVGLYADINGVE